MAIILYGDEVSPPVRAVMLACKALGINYEFKKVSVMNGDHKKPEFIKINPLHTIPTVQDGDFIIYDSHAIVTYLADKVSSDSWYPKDIKKRAIVTQRLHFDNSVLFTRLRHLLEPLAGGATAYDPERTMKLVEALEFLARLIQEGGWLTGDKPTIADVCAAANVSSILAVLPPADVPEKVAVWFKKCEKELPEFQTTNKPGNDALGNFVQSKLK
ncbi:hypothetical protein FOCC_FOCC012626 [Frankliniella occidentalis]|uniref:Glutathione S-transferase 1-like n=1 Tax=Frankliniella occidentalis TaxID=133901 RepID=A0A6J1RY40_FRAOC|nr:glutathione S-transferase 1-like [Frankliniella occidentalis]XP_052128089.1 glutathione S-transferase 1-like [Frankliniella occidentalis]KAE8741840.1 hypothetical protein FOCC_FOCC012626 [Frankliniella occidentalis]